MLALFVYTIVILAASAAANRHRNLNTSGAIAAFFVGILIALGFGWRGLIVLGVFFATSSYWSKYKKEYKYRIEEKLEKGSRRDWQQVLANGGTAAVASLLYFYYDGTTFLILFSIAIASANSDTWASEIGSLSKRPPIFIRTLKRSEKGTSGAVSFLGTLSGLIGSLLIALISTLLFNLTSYQLVFIFLFGFLGNIFDTLIGAFLQAAYRCQSCSTEIEKTFHCDMPAQLIRGIPFMNNDAVNFLSGLLAAIVGVLIYSSI